MASPSIIPKVAYCSEKQRFTDQFVEAAREILRLQDAEIKAVVNGGSGIERFDIAMRVARRRLDEAKSAYLRHVREHGC